MPPRRNMGIPGGKVSFKPIGKIFAYAKRFLPLAIISFLASIAASVFVIIGPTEIEKVSDYLVEGITSPQGVAMEPLQNTFVFLIVIYSAMTLCNFLSRLLTNEVTHRLSRKLRSEIGEKIDRLPLAYFDANTTGDILSRITNDVDTISQTLGSAFAEFLSAVTLFVGITIMMFVVNWILALVTIGSALLGFVLISLILSFSQKFFHIRQKCLGEMNGNIEEAYSNHKIIKAFNAEKKNEATFNDINGRLRKNNRNAMFLSSLMGPVMNFTGNLSYALVFIVGVALALQDQSMVTFGTIMAFTIYARNFSNPLSTFAQALSYVQQASAAATRVFEMLEAPEMEDESEKSLALPKIRGDVTFDHVGFSYDETREIIHDFSANLKAGSKVAIVGPTGAGKTTMVNLLMRFYEVKRGRILIDGVDIRDYKREQVHEFFDMILQDTWLFNGTVRENLAFNKEGVKDEEILSALEAVGLGHFIAALPKGLDAILDEGASLSEGQKQQLTIARAMIKDSPMLILDEATSSVDTRTERHIQNAMDALTKGRTSFVIAHRLSTIRNADIILVMKDGDIVEQGNHKELLSKGGFYAELYNSQFAPIEEEG